MSDEKKVVFSYNSALTKLDEATGKFDRDEHAKAVAPLRGQIMQVDGICGCFIARYAIEVEYMTGVTSKERVEVAIKDIFEEWAPKNGFFPLRDGKTIKVEVDKN